MEHGVLLQAISMVSGVYMAGMMRTHGVPYISQISVYPACSLWTAQVAYGRRELVMIYELESLPESKGGYRGKRGKQYLSDGDHDETISQRGRGVLV